MVKVLTIIVSYNFEPWLDKCIQSLLGSTHPTDILVVDNNSKDNTVQLLEKHYPSVQIIKNNINLGFGKANNIGMRRAVEQNYDYVFLANQDGWVKDDCIGNLLKMASHNGVGIISPIHMDGTGEKLDKGFEVYTTHFKLENGLKTVTFVNAAFWLLPVDVIKKTGGFSPIFYHYGEDTDFVNRINFHGFKIILADDAVAFHDRQNRPLNKQAFLKSEFVYFLTEYCNINYSGFKAVLLSIAASAKKSFLSIRKGNFSYAKAYFMIIFKLLAMSPEVFKTRHLNKKIYPEIV